MLVKTLIIAATTCCLQIHAKLQDESSNTTIETMPFGNRVDVLLEDKFPRLYEPSSEKNKYPTNEVEEYDRTTFRMVLNKTKEESKKGAEVNERYLAICPNNEPLSWSSNGGDLGLWGFKPICRVYINNGNTFTVTTGSFVTQQESGGFSYTVITSATSIIDKEEQQWRIEDLEQFPSYVCCVNSKLYVQDFDDECPLEGRFRIRAVSVLSSYYKRGTSFNQVDNAAMLGLRKYTETIVDSLYPFRWTTFSNDRVCDQTIPFDYSGFLEDSSSCTKLGQDEIYGEEYQSITKGMLNCNSVQTGTSTMQFPGSACSSFFGGPLLYTQTGEDKIVGVLATYSPSCTSTGTSSLYFSRYSTSSSISGFNPNTLARALTLNRRNLA